MDASSRPAVPANATRPGPKSRPSDAEITVREYLARSGEQSTGRVWLPRLGIEVSERDGRIISDSFGPAVDLGPLTSRELEAMVRSKRREKQAAWRLDQLFEGRGRRYRSCTLENFKVSTPEQRSVVDALRKYRDSISRRPESGAVDLAGIVLTGPAGTGKDHLLAAMMTAAIRQDYSVEWTSGAALWAAFRLAIGKNDGESELVKKYTEADVFAISDPKPITGSLTAYQQEMLYAIVDARYNHERPTWATINAAIRADAENAVGVPIVDRMRDGAMSLGCAWESFRKSRGQR